ncbi:hypothetical protein CTAYLR_003394 [Chrysophaeum taylorii]|uniref:Transglutaminase-like domain-containing protein n=1 Tax=Chrysophaeum taylorii TaxID=2483200 RepID=A0AAD7U8F5_9STRA|nr:hypothetical protein CTAYLR_003394 [Chrysophaeum taylorii]
MAATGRRREETPEDDDDNGENKSGACEAIWASVADTTCSRFLIGRSFQPQWSVGGAASVCGTCAKICLPPGVAEVVETGVLTAFRCEMAEVAARGLGQDVFGEAPRIEKVDDFRLLEGALRAAVAAQASGSCEALRATLSSGLATRRAHEDPAAQAAALAAMPEEVRSYRYEGSSYPPDAALSALIKWFKGGLFKWFNKPDACASCGTTNKANLKYHSTTGPASEAEVAGKASRVEVYACALCGSKETRFPRFNDAVTLLSSRRGRCGEFANCFTLCCVALGFRARYVLDVTDHVWTEVWSAEKRRWLHADPCEKKVDKPRMYEKGWGKKLIAVFAFGPDADVVDVTRRYARDDYGAVLRRRFERWACTEATIAAEIKRLSPRAEEDPAERNEFATNIFADNDADDGEVFRGRTAGDAEWIAARGEAGNLPKGSWLNSARNAKVVDGAILEADLRTCDGDWRRDAVHILHDADEFDNIDGRFRRAETATLAGLDGLAAKLRDEAQGNLEVRRLHLKLLKNIATDPTKDKFRRLRTDNDIVKNVILAPPSAQAWLRLAVGFAPDSDAFLVAPPHPPLLDQARAALERAWPLPP